MKDGSLGYITRRIDRTKDGDKIGTYDPETGTFSMQMISFLPDYGFYNWGASLETLTMNKPITKRDTVDIISSKMFYHEFLASNQAVQFYAGNDLEGYTTFLVTSKNATSVEGTFDIYEGYSFADSIDGSQIGFEEGQITIAKEGDVYHLTGWVIGDNEKYYRLDWTEKAGVLEFDTDAPFDAEFILDEDSSGIKDGVVSISSTNADNQTIDLELYVDPSATEIPAGTYVISDTKEAGTALKSQGLSGDTLTKCFAGLRGTSGISKGWFMVEGTVTISYSKYGEMLVSIAAKNSYGQDITVKTVGGSSRNYGYSVRLVTDVK